MYLYSLNINMRHFLYAKQDLGKFAPKDVFLLADHLDISRDVKDYGDLLWLLTLTIHQSFKRSQMPTQEMSTISYEDTLKFAGGELAHIEYMSDAQINYFLHNNEIISIDHPMIRNSEDPDETVDHLERVLYQIKQLKSGNKLEDIEIYFGEDGIADIYDGWHRIRAYQFLKYEKIPVRV